MIPHIEHRPDGSVLLNFPYNRTFIHELKTRISSHARSYDPATRTWTINAVYADLAGGLMAGAFAEVVHIGATLPTPDPIRQTDRDYAALHLLPTAPLSLIEAAFRCLSKEFHPDRGGQHEAMITINAAVSALRARQGQGVAS